ncbi:ATP-dependent helicase, partial [Candidatus Nomurabacteria bacterium]|nr:ATP-dependent helicase [Candidatus Nomurabacteria bacterium]
DMDDFRQWADNCAASVDQLIQADGALKKFVESKKAEIKVLLSDHQKLNDLCVKNNYPLGSRVIPTHLRQMAEVSGLSDLAIRRLSSRRLVAMAQNGDPKATIGYLINRATSLDWGLLDLFYQFTAFSYFRGLIDKASNGEDEGPICNLGLLTEYISRYQEKRGRPIITANDVAGEWIQKDFFMSYLFAMYRLGESEFEDDEDPFPKGRVSFITIHQAKGLEFPVVILGSLYRKDSGPDAIEIIVREELGRPGEPLERMVEFDNARLFYVALSRAQNLLILPRYSGRGQNRLRSFHAVIDKGLPHLRTLDFKKIPSAKALSDDSLGRAYSYTTDYLMYKKCPRQYMLFRKYDFVPARASVMLFGSLIHQTLEDLHNYLLAQRRVA